MDCTVVDLDAYNRGTFEDFVENIDD